MATQRKLREQRHVRLAIEPAHERAHKARRTLTFNESFQRKIDNMSISKKFLRKRIKSWLIERLFTYSGGNYQRDRFPTEKFDLIASRLDLSRIGNVLDVGCNEGFISAEFSRRGKFCVGIDVGPYFLNYILNDLENIYGSQSPAFGVFPLAEKNVNSIPEFDLVLLLSVHHQWTKRYGNDYSERLVKKLAEKSRHYFLIEFSATAQKYGFKEPQFIDNDEDSVKAYAESWLRSLQVTGNIEYLGKNKEHITGSDREPYRFLFMIVKGPK